jgi:demethylmenaquinone methyltransferase/2-methoxy-6-polyprenyl-1,4-benzoquinol methylase
VLYAGAGTGHECLFAAERGVEVTVADTSGKMLAVCQKRFRRAGAFARFLQADALSLEEARFDVVVAPFFLNVFASCDVPGAMASLAKLVRPGGSLIAVDFRAPSQNAALRVLQKAYYLAPLALFGLLTKNPWHPLYDYETIAQSAGLPLTLEARKETKAFGLPLFETLVWRTE